MYPQTAIRELVANAIIHQDLLATGDSPLVEIFSDRIESQTPDVLSSIRFASSMSRLNRATKTWLPSCAA